MGVGLTDEELWRTLTSSHTGILVTLRADGRPVPVPIWFVVLNRRIYVRALEATAKVKRIQRDPRASFMVEAGEQWSQLAAIVLQVEGRVVDGAAAEEAVAALEGKYAAFRHRNDATPEATRRYYAGRFVVLELRPVGAAASWDNAKIRPTADDSSGRSR